MLQLHNISKHFPGIKALDNISLTIDVGEIHALCGENGAGKSTLMNILTGNLQPDTGQIRLNGQVVQIENPALATALGIAIVYQQLSLIDSLTVAENVYANRQPKNRLGLIREKVLIANTQALLNRLALTDIQPTQLVSDLSPGQKQMVEIAKALSQNPTILLLDEPTASLTNRETNSLFALLRQLRAASKAIVYISHRLPELFELADRVSVLKDGRYQGTEQVADTSTDALIRRMVGRDLVDQKSQSSTTDEVLLQVQDLSGERFQSISFRLHKGEILGMAGLVGAGRTEIARAIFGIDSRRSGTVWLHGQEVDLTHPSDAVRCGIGYLPEERKRLGLFMEQSVAQNIVAAQPTNDFWYNSRQATEVAESFRKQLGIRTPSVRELVRNLSGGNQQKTMLARWLLANPEVLIVDEPTHGIDVGGKAEIYTILRTLAAQGKGVLLISSELPELLSLADRILVVRNGQLSGELSREEATEERIMTLATD